MSAESVIASGALHPKHTYSFVSPPVPASAQEWDAGNPTVSEIQSLGFDAGMVPGEYVTLDNFGGSGTKSYLSNTDFLGGGEAGTPSFDQYGLSFRSKPGALLSFRIVEDITLPTATNRRLVYDVDVASLILLNSEAYGVTLEAPVSEYRHQAPPDGWYHHEWNAGASRLVGRIVHELPAGHWDHEARFTDGRVSFVGVI